jgi:hypothetical protein
MATLSQASPAPGTLRPGSTVAKLTNECFFDGISALQRNPDK